MRHEFCTRLTAMIRHLGYAPHRADCLVMFLVRCMTLVCAVMEVLVVPEDALWETCGRTKNRMTAAGPFAHIISPAASPSRQRQPA